MKAQELIASFPEINPANYNDDDVNALNAWGIAAVNVLAALIAIEEAQTVEPFAWVVLDEDGAPV